MGLGFGAGCVFQHICSHRLNEQLVECTTIPPGEIQEGSEEQVARSKPGFQKATVWSNFLKEAGLIDELLDPLLSFQNLNAGGESRGTQLNRNKFILYSKSFNS